MSRDFILPLNFFILRLTDFPVQHQSELARSFFFKIAVARASLSHTIVELVNTLGSSGNTKIRESIRSLRRDTYVK